MWVIVFLFFFSFLLLSSPLLSFPFPFLFFNQDSQLFQWAYYRVIYSTSMVVHHASWLYWTLDSFPFFSLSIHTLTPHCLNYICFINRHIKEGATLQYLPHLQILPHEYISCYCLSGSNIKHCIHLLSFTHTHTPIGIVFPWKGYLFMNFGIIYSCSHLHACNPYNYGIHIWFQMEPYPN